MSSAAPLLTTLAARGEGPPLFLAPSVGTTPLSLVRLARSIVPALRVYAFAYAGLEDDSPAHDTFEAMASACVDELVAKCPEGPCLVGGHCLGGAVAHAITHELEARGRTVSRLVVMDSVAPLPADASGPMDAKVEDHARRAIADVVERTLSHSGTFSPEMFRRLAGLLKLHIEAGAAYRAQPIRAPLCVLRSRAFPDDVVEGWTRIATGALSRHEVPGDTFSMLRPPHVDAVGRILGRVLMQGRP